MLIYDNMKERHMNYLARKIIVWYKDRGWAKEIYREVCSSFPIEAIKRFSEKDLWFECQDGTLFRMVHANDYARGYRAHENYVQCGVDKETYISVIAPHLIQPVTDAWVITEARQIYQGATRASKYYDLE